MVRDTYHLNPADGWRVPGGDSELPVGSGVVNGLEFLRDVHAIVFDVGETLVDESRAWAELAGITSLTLAGVLGAIIERGEHHSRVWDVLEMAPPAEPPTIRGVDLYPDELECLHAVRQAGLIVGIAGNQPAGAEAELRTAGFEADFIASSATWGVSKPSPEFFSRVIEYSETSAEHIVYVGDRLDNDVMPARNAGMRTILIRRGPWGYLHAQHPDATLASARIDTLAEITSAIAARI
jgi:HAD superfamily hydrolase (TIGR01509 family)